MAQFSAKDLKTIGVFTSGGDAPGMNAALRAVVRAGIHQGLQIKGLLEGYSGLLRGEAQDLTLNSMANIIQRGGTVLKTGRCPEFHQPEARAQAAENLRKAGVQALICIGGDGSFAGAHLLWQEHQIPIVGVPGTIDNDIWGTDSTIGFDTAINTALTAIDRIRDTAASHNRLFIVEVMGRDSGFIAIDVGLAGGAEEIFIPEKPLDVTLAVDHIKKGMARGKKSSILVTAEGPKPGRAYELAEAIKDQSGFEAKICILGHIQRGGSPTAGDRVLASRLGAGAVEALSQGRCDVMVGVQSGQITHVGFEQAVGTKKTVSEDLIHLSRILST
jgi:6-phosphofructokinase 1